MTPEPTGIADRPCTADLFLGGRVLLLQPEKGHRAGLDAALLQALVPSDAAGHAVDFGSGTGAVAFCLAARALALRVTGIERDAALVSLGRSALERHENALFSARVSMVAADVTAAAFPADCGLADESADWVLMNPPFDVAGKVRESPDRFRRAAHVADAPALAGWVRAAARLLCRGGRLGLIHRAAALADVLAVLPRDLGDVRVRPVHPSADKAASRILVLATRGSRAAPAILPGLVLHERDGAWTEQADDILRGNADLAR